MLHSQSICWAKELTHCLSILSSSAAYNLPCLPPSPPQIHASPSLSFVTRPSVTWFEGARLSRKIRIEFWKSIIEYTYITYAPDYMVTRKSQSFAWDILASCSLHSPCRVSKSLISHTGIVVAYASHCHNLTIFSMENEVTLTTFHSITRFCDVMTDLRRVSTSFLPRWFLVSCSLHSHRTITVCYCTSNFPY
jgi:hypothetical protein